MIEIGHNRLLKLGLVIQNNVLLIMSWFVWLVNPLVVYLGPLPCSKKFTLRWHHTSGKVLQTLNLLDLNINDTKNNIWLQFCRTVWQMSFFFAVVFFRKKATLDWWSCKTIGHRGKVQQSWQIQCHCICLCFCCLAGSASILADTGAACRVILVCKCSFSSTVQSTFF